QMAADTKEQLNAFITNDFAHTQEDIKEIKKDVAANKTRHAVITAIGTLLIIVVTILSRILF
ncbi:hypothetical protein LCGC14_2060570, partial [marine sediment metagenome]